MIIVSVIIIFLVYLIINHIFNLRKTVEGVTAGSNESKKITEINTNTENNDISLNSLNNFSDTISTRCAAVSLFIAVPTKDDPPMGPPGSAYNTHEKIKSCLLACNKPKIPFSKKKTPPPTKSKG